jgi:hypothetical protein
MDGRPLLPAMRVAAYASMVLAAVGFFDFYVAADSTADYSPWTINPPMSAAFLGAGYAAGFVLFLQAIRERLWVRTRIAFLTVWEFTVFSLIATLMHDDKFHFDTGPGVARAAAWFWLAVYAGYPLVVGILMVVQERMRGNDPPVTRPHPPLLIAVLVAQGTVMIAVGIALFVKPLSMNDWWPWTLTPLTARSIAAWFLALGIASFHAILERDLPRLRPAAVTYVVFAIVQFTAVLRWRDDFDWDSGWSWVYVGWLASVALVGLYGIIASRPSAAGAPTVDLTRGDRQAPAPASPPLRSRARARDR